LEKIKEVEEMANEELEKDVRDYLRQKFGLNGGSIVSCDLKDLLLDFAEPREERIAELEAQIEKMKCCPTCDNNKEEHTPEEDYRCRTCKKFCNWELAD
jgi:hypothetical protein